MFRQISKGLLPSLAFFSWLLSLPVWAAPFKYAEDRTPTTLNPIFADDMYSVRITELIFDRLIGWDTEQRPAPMLATSWQMSKDKRSIIIQLRKGVKWHDGQPFTAKDVAFTIEAMTGRRAKINDRYLAQIIKSVKVLGPHQIQIFFKRPMTDAVRWLQFKVIPAHKFARGKIRRSDYFSQKPVGTGPFKFIRWRSRKIILKKFGSHWRGGEIKLDGVFLVGITDKNIQVEVLRYGGIDAIIRVRPKDIPIFERDRNIRLYPYSTNDWWYVAFNHKRGSIFRDIRVREAFVYALDRDTLRNSYLGEGQTISGPFSPNDPLYNFSVPAREQDIEKANALLDQAGWKKTPDGIRRKGRKILSVKLYVPKSKSSYKALCLAMQSSWRKIGAVVDIVWLEDVSWTKQVMRKKQFDLALHIWNFDDLSTIYPLFHSKGVLNYISYRNREVDKLLDQANKTTDPVIYKAIFGKLHKLLHKELPYIFLWSLTNYSAMSARIKGVIIHPFNFFHYAYRWSKIQRE